MILNPCHLKVIDKKLPPGKESEVIEPQDAVLINVEGWVANDNTAVKPNEEGVFQEAKSWLIVIGEGDVLPAIEMGARFMETGQTALIWSHSKYAMGPGTRTYQKTTVLPHSNVMFKLTITQKVMDTSRLNPYFTIQKALTKKRIANDIYQFEWCPAPQSKDDPVCEQAMNRAIRLYTKTSKEMETLLQGNYFQSVEKDHPQRVESHQLLLDALNNIVAVYLKQKQYHKAKLASVEVLQVDPHNLKALLRAAKAAMLDPASTLEEAKAAIVAAESEITYKNPEEEKKLHKLKALLKKKQQEYKDASKSMFGNKLKSSSTISLSKDEQVASQEVSLDKQVSDTGTASKKPTINEKDSEEPLKGENNQAPSKEIEEMTDGQNFWRKQATAAFVQVVIPLLIFLLYRYLNPEMFGLGGKTAPDSPMTKKNE
jgi:hypothetical protein